MCQLTIATPGHDSVQHAVRQAREYALRNPSEWASALHNLANDAENDIVFAAMEGDEAHVGRRLIHWLREQLIADVTDRVMDEINTELDRETQVWA